MDNQNGIIGNIGGSKRSVYGIAAMGMILKLSASEAKYALAAMILITILAVAYMVLDEVKDRRNKSG